MTTKKGAARPRNGAADAEDQQRLETLLRMSKPKPRKGKLAKKMRKHYG